MRLKKIKTARKLNIFGREARFHHAGMALYSIDTAFRRLNKTAEPAQKVNTAMVNMHDITVELVEPLSGDSPVKNILKKQQGIYHLCFQVKDMQKALRTARKNGFNCISPPAESHAFKGKKTAWVFSRTCGLVELLES